MRLLTHTCKLNDVGPEDWSSNRVHELLPWNFPPVK
ncbi:transposase domain-containing protein [Salmonella enterica]|nr:transposase domain-containing protein [Salmonella enterica subsp. enterica serovar Enteritidis]EEG4459262.1 transposase domain-containing protein [Salmonella enterica]EDB9461574.1 transposase domain-containing protein [Salmonella enterica subsp. enterica serovar Enteritidis]EDB9780890.1 transposase domain-containing protein [Salmonella enterica subsp. enterica serovar Enteritidis]EDC0018886.1 transposase domain-containing protein [Salmonella enterica subsp. enterica serovar Enteritidis]